VRWLGRWRIAMSAFAMSVELGLQRLLISFALRAIAVGLRPESNVRTSRASSLDGNVSQPFDDANEGLLQSSACHNWRCGATNFGQGL
jgi:hypothetical protein